jgi:hypothetical protein
MPDELTATGHWPAAGAGIFLLAVVAMVVAQRWVARRVSPPFRPVMVYPAHAPSDPMLKVQCCSELEEVVFLHVTGTATNVGCKPLKNVIAHATFFNRDGNAVASAQALLANPILLPFGTSDFHLATPANPQITKVAVDFRSAGGTPIPTKFAQPVAPGAS